jgi:hypothetical protein
MSDSQQGASPSSASLDEDPNATVSFSSPPCFMHELDPAYLGYLRPDEVSALVGAVLAADWAGTVPDEARLRAALGRHLGAPGGEHQVPAGSEPPRRIPDALARTIREALPRIHDDALRRDLDEVLGALEKASSSQDNA